MSILTPPDARNEPALDPDLDPDPLASLRAADPRSFDQRWRDALRARAANLAAHRSLATLAALALIVALVGYRLLTAQVEPPIEDSLPVAVERTVPPAAPNTNASSTTDVDAGTPTATVVVHVAGAVRQPGLVHGDPTWRVHDAVLAAGGALRDADHNRINLAALITDGQRIYVPSVDEDTIPVVPGPSGATDPATTPGTVGPVDLNTADETLLQTIPGIGPATATSIVSHRTEHGPFGSVDALVAVRGIGPATVEALRDHVVVG